MKRLYQLNIPLTISYKINYFVYNYSIIDALTYLVSACEEDIILFCLILFLKLGWGLNYMLYKIYAI